MGMRVINTDYLVIGSGLAGLTAALNLSRLGNVLIATKRSPDESNTQYAQGGIACAISEKDSISSHVEDTMATGCGLSRREAVEQIIAGGPEAVRFLEAQGLRFATMAGEPRQYDLGREGGHSHRRVMHVGDLTGQEIIRVLLEKVAENPQITMMPHLMAIDLVTLGWLGIKDKDYCIGAYFLDKTKNEVIGIRAAHTVLATGGAGKVYLYTSNPDIATGDGVAMAWRAGLPVRNMEFVQFHPTCLYHPEAKSFLISEVVRGEGGILINTAGESFTEKYDARGSLAPRDIVARAIDHEMKTRGDRCVYLDITGKPRDYLINRFPNIYRTCLNYGIDITKSPVPVVPAAHYFCGGVETDTRGYTALPGLYILGEAACTGLHGANRLASNSLLEAVVVAFRLAESLSAASQLNEYRQIDIPPWKIGDAVPSDEAVVVEHNWNEVRTCMWDYVGIVRTDKRLERAARRIRNLRREIRQYYLDYVVTADVLELRNIAAVAGLVIRSAQARKESRGLHYSLDYTYCDKRKACDTVICDRPGKGK